MMDLHVVWFLLLGALLAGYAVLDGFDLGVGILHLISREDRERRLMLNSIGPIWDGNEVWLVTFGGALFAAFPEAYATIFSGFYEAFMILLFALIFRATAIEFRSKVESTRWRTVWDIGFFSSSLVASFLFGVAVGNAVIGIPLDERGIFIGNFASLLGHYPILMGFLSVSLFAMHGALYLHLKIPKGDLHKRIGDWIWHAWGIFLVLFLLTTIYTLIEIPKAVPHFEELPWSAGVVILIVVAIAYIPRATYLGRTGRAFLASSLVILCLVTLLGLTLWPNLVTASNDSSHSLTIYTAASSPKTLKIMLVIALIGMPLVLAYTAIVYWTFRRRVELGEGSY